MKYSHSDPRSQPASCYKVLIVIADYIKYFGNNYCFPSQEHILEVLKNRHDCKIKIRQLNYILRFLEDSGQILRVQRNSKDPENPEKGMLFRSTMYWIKTIGWRLLNRMRRAVGGVFDKARDAKTDDPGNGQESYRAVSGNFESIGGVFSKTIPKPAH